MNPSTFSVATGHTDAEGHCPIHYTFFLGLSKPWRSGRDVALYSIEGLYAHWGGAIELSTHLAHHVNVESLFRRGAHHPDAWEVNGLLNETGAKLDVASRELKALLTLLPAPNPDIVMGERPTVQGLISKDWPPPSLQSLLHSTALDDNIVLPRGQGKARKTAPNEPVIDALYLDVALRRGVFNQTKDEESTSFLDIQRCLSQLPLYLQRRHGVELISEYDLTFVYSAKRITGYSEAAARSLRDAHPYVKIILFEKRTMDDGAVAYDHNLGVQAYMQESKRWYMPYDAYSQEKTFVCLDMNTRIGNDYRAKWLPRFKAILCELNAAVLVAPVAPAPPAPMVPPPVAPAPPAPTSRLRARLEVPQRGGYRHGDPRVGLTVRRLRGRGGRHRHPRGVSRAVESAPRAREERP